jgi:hypothetical protein
MKQTTTMDELSKDKLQSYVAAAVQDYGSAKKSNATKRVKRYVGIDRAVSKLGKGARVKATEENKEQLAAEAIIDGFANLNHQKKAEFVDYLKRTFHDPNNYEEQSFEEELDSTLEEFGFTDETLGKAEQLFWEAVANNGDVKLRGGIANLLGIYGPLLEGDDVIEVLGERIQELESNIAYVEGENLRLASEVKEKLSEDFLQQATKAERPVKQSHIDEQLEELNDDTTFAQGETYVPQNMLPYLRFLK